MHRTPLSVQWSPWTSTASVAPRDTSGKVSQKSQKRKSLTDQIKMLELQGFIESVWKTWFKLPAERDTTWGGWHTQDQVEARQKATPSKSGVMQCLYVHMFCLSPLPSARQTVGYKYQSWGCSRPLQVPGAHSQRHTQVCPATAVAHQLACWANKGFICNSWAGHMGSRMGPWC